MNAPAAPLSDPSLLQVLLVCSRGEHLQRVRSLASRWPQAANIHWTCDPEEAMRRAKTCPPHLAIVDARLDRGCDSWHWSELPKATGWWVKRHFGVRSPRRIH